ncbi:MAG: DNA polymerase III subunit gamma/tau [Paludibacter sp.]|nr:DNA polymerase III subunit gamma/tau [Paludibacter sp.]
MDNFIVSARKYRPTTFNSVVGQSALTTTLKNAIKSNHLAHAYLFCGTRGVGKTTCARIFAKTINCMNPTADHEACNECESCISFNEQRSYNIHELDAASNNSVDDIRTLIEQVRIPPQIGKYSVFIVDEVHMLSTGAFNAFLKTLEEPPAHAIFILATTEKHKIIPTILSRCQIYDFNRITVADTVAHLKYVADSEGVTVDMNALNVIAQKSDGGMRDALSIFDQIVSFCGNNITYQGVIDNLNVLDYEYYFRIVESFLEGNVSKSLLIFNDILNKGFDAQHFITGLSTHLRDVLVSKDSTTIQLLEVGHDIGKKYEVQAQQCSAEFLYQALKISNDCDLNYRLSKNKRLLVELALIRMCQLNDEKKKSSLADNDKIPLKKLEAETNPTVTSPQIPAASAKTVIHNTEPAKPQEIHVQIQPKVGQTQVSPSAANKPDRQGAPHPGFKRPASIFINNKPQMNSGTEQVSVQKDIHQQSSMNKSFTEDELVVAWRKFGQTIEDDIKRVNFENTNLPKKTGDTTFEILVNNVMQENEMKKIQTDIIQFLYYELQNSSIRMQVKVSEENELQRTISPEEKYKMMIEENPFLEQLRKNLGMELD